MDAILGTRVNWNSNFDEHKNYYYFAQGWNPFFLNSIKKNTSLSFELRDDIHAFFCPSQQYHKVPPDGDRTSNFIAWLLCAKHGEEIPNELNKEEVLCCVLKNKTQLNLREKNINRRAIQTLCQALMENNSIIQLDLRGNQLNNDDASLLKALVQQNKHIIQLDLEDNPIDRPILQAIWEELAIHCPLMDPVSPFIKLPIEGNMRPPVFSSPVNIMPVEGNMGPPVFNLVTPPHQLNLFGNRVQFVVPDGLVPVKLVKDPETGKYVILSDSPSALRLGFGDSVIQVNLILWERNQLLRLREANKSGEKPEEIVDVPALIDSLFDDACRNTESYRELILGDLIFSQLKKLDLKCIGASLNFLDWVKLCNALSKNQSITTLELPCSSDTSFWVCSVIKQNKTLSHLTLSVAIDGERFYGESSILRALKMNCFLKGIEFEGKPISQEFQSAIEEELAINAELQGSYIQISNNSHQFQKPYILNWGPDFNQMLMRSDLFSKAQKIFIKKWAELGIQPRDEHEAATAASWILSAGLPHGVDRSALLNSILPKLKKLHVLSCYDNKQF